MLEHGAVRQKAAEEEEIPMEQPGGSLTIIKEVEAVVICNSDKIPGRPDPENGLLVIAGKGLGNGWGTRWIRSR